MPPEAAEESAALAALVAEWSDNRDEALDTLHGMFRLYDTCGAAAERGHMRARLLSICHDPNEQLNKLPRKLGELCAAQGETARYQQLTRSCERARSCTT